MGKNWKHNFKVQGEERFSDKVFAVRLPESQAARLMQFNSKERTKFIQSAIIEKLDRLNIPQVQSS